MRPTKHFRQRMSQRGLSSAIVQAAVDFGVIDQDKYVLGRKDAQLQIESLQQQLRALKKIADKGGVAVVADGNSLITTYNLVQGR